MPNYAKRMDYMGEVATAMKGLFESIGDPNTITFGGGIPAADALPIEKVQEIANELLAKDGRGYEMLQYGNPRGMLSLREVVANQMLKPKGVEHADPDNVLITVGGMEAISLLCQVYLEPGDKVLVESPSFIQTFQTLKLFEAEVIASECDENGFVLDKLEEDIKKHKPKFVYCIPTFQNPSGNTTPLENRKKLAEIASKYDVILLEDDPYSEMRYSGEELPPIQAFDKTGNVVYCNTFSKIFSPGSRIGYIHGSSDIMSKIYDVKVATNSHTSMLPQALCAEFFKRGMYPAHLAHIREVHKERRDAMMSDLKEFMPEGVSWTFPDGGLFTWVKVPEHISTSKMLPEAVAAGVKYLPGITFFEAGQPIHDNYMRMSFSGSTPDKIKEGVKILADVIKKHI